MRIQRARAWMNAHLPWFGNEANAQSRRPNQAASAPPGACTPTDRGHAPPPRPPATPNPQAAPRRLWDHLDSLRDQWLRDGSLPVYGAAVVITPDGSITFQRGKW